MKDSKWVIVMLLLSVVSITVQNYLLRTDISRSREAYKKDLDDVYFLMKNECALESLISLPGCIAQSNAIPQ